MNSRLRVARHYKRGAFSVSISRDRRRLRGRARPSGRTSVGLDLIGAPGSPGECVYFDGALDLEKLSGLGERHARSGAHQE